MHRRTIIAGTAVALGAGTISGTARIDRDRPAASPAIVHPAAAATPRGAAAAPVAAGGMAQASVAAGTAPDARAIERGARLFISYNCGDCHGAAGSGAMAPSLQDNRWHYGGSQGDVFRSIAEGRPRGMPTWGAIISGPDMIALTAYVRSLGEGKDLTTENFTGATVERSGR